MVDTQHYFGSIDFNLFFDKSVYYNICSDCDAIPKRQSSPLRFGLYFCPKRRKNGSGKNIISIRTLLLFCLALFLFCEHLIQTKRELPTKLRYSYDMIKFFSRKCIIHRIIMMPKVKDSNELDVLLTLKHL